MQSISYKDVTLTDGFWKRKYDMNRDVTMYAVLERFQETGRFDAFKCDWKEGEPNKPHFFWDSDIAKWIEGAAYLLTKEANPKIEKIIDETISLIEKNQGQDGYFNIYFTVCEPENRFKHRTDHELYCAGHLIEAAVAYYEATGKDHFLTLMRKYADYIEKVFVTEQTANFVTPGHEEIEHALIRLYKCTGEGRYLNLVRFFIDQRGNNEKDKKGFHDFALAAYDQSHRPVREQMTAEGHAVRACYLYCAMAELAKETNDSAMLAACKRIFNNIAGKRMYITGGIGSTQHGEAFTIDYDLPNQTAYAETCAAVALMMFAQRMLEIEPDSIYSDVIERIFYNGLLSGISLDGNSFFYENPLEIIPAYHNRHVSTKRGGSYGYFGEEHFSITQRVEMFGCSCCPPNLNRLFGSIGSYIYGAESVCAANPECAEIYYIHQYTGSEFCSGDVKITQITDYPINGDIIVRTEGVKRLAFRIPAWCDDYSISAPYILKDGYAYTTGISVPCEISIHFDMKPVLMQSSPLVVVNAGRAALQYGPIVYCLEGIDNGSNLQNVWVTGSANMNFKIGYDEYFGANIITADGFRPIETTELYSKWNGAGEKIRLKFIPYYAFANRGESEMLVWVRVK